MSGKWNGESLAYPGARLEIDSEYADKGVTISTRVEHPGLTKRELFAAMAMQGVSADPTNRSPMEAAFISVQWADALLAALNAEESK